MSHQLCYNMFLLSSTIKHSVSVEKVSEPLDLRTGWSFLGSDDLKQASCSCGLHLYNVHMEFWIILSYRTSSAQTLSTASLLGWGPGLTGWQFRWSFPFCSTVTLMCCITQLLLSFIWCTATLTLSCRILLCIKPGKFHFISWIQFCEGACTGLSYRYRKQICCQRSFKQLVNQKVLGCLMSV